MALAAGLSRIAVRAMACAVALHAVTAAADERLEEIEVTGSRIVQAGLDSASPIVSVPASAFAESSPVSAERALAMMPQFVPAVGGTTNTPGNDGQANLSLRGIGSAQTLVLVDGKRLMPSDGRGSVDLNLLPPVMIEAVDVMTGGASVVYGSDAIAGVVNFRLREKLDGFEAHAEWMQTAEGDGEEYSAGLLAGTPLAGGRGDVLAYLGYAERELVTQDQRRSSRRMLAYYPDETEGLGPGGAFLGSGSGVMEEGVAVVFSDPEVFERVFETYGYAPGTAFYYPGLGVNTDRTVFTIGDNRTPGSVVNFRGEVDPRYFNDRQHTFDTAPTTALQLPLERISAIVRGRFEFSPAYEAYGQLIYADYSSTRQLAPTGSGILLVPPTNPYIPADLGTLLASRVNPSVPFRFQRRMSEVDPLRAENDRELWQVTLGLRGSLPGEWRYDAYAQAGRNERDERQRGNVRVSRLEDLLFAPDGGVAICGGFDPFGKQTANAACIDYVTIDAANQATVDQSLAEVTFSGPLFELPAGPVNVAIGLLYKRDEFEYVPDPALTEFVPEVPGVIGPRPDVSGFGAGAARSGDESSVDLYGEARLPLLRDDGRGRALELGVGYRFSEYDQAGSADAYKAEFTFQPRRLVIFRGSYQHAVRAPSIEELYYPEVAGQFLFEPPDPCSVSSSQRNGPDRIQVEALCLAQGMTPAQLETFRYDLLRRVEGVSGGNPDLEPEEADTYTVGVVLKSPFTAQALRDLTLTADWYRIDFQHGIGRWPVDIAKDRCFSPVYNPNYDAANGFCGFFRRTPATGEIFALEIDQNVGGVDTSGVDVQLDWSIPVGPGQLGADLLVNYVDEWRATEPNGGEVEYVGTIGFRALGSAIPRWRSLLALHYGWAGVTLYSRWQHVDAMRDARYPDFRVPSRDYVDAGATYEFDDGWLEGLVATIGVENLFDESPPIFPSYSQSNTEPALYDVLGQRYFVSLRYRF
jgi:outer membrane receptor protein involved in Fe transport